jgi:hypothetical protein
MEYFRLSIILFLLRCRPTNDESINLYARYTEYRHQPLVILRAQVLDQELKEDSQVLPSTSRHGTVRRNNGAHDQVRRLLVFREHFPTTLKLAHVRPPRFVLNWRSQSRQLELRFLTIKAMSSRKHPWNFQKVLKSTNSIRVQISSQICDQWESLEISSVWR